MIHIEPTAKLAHMTPTPSSAEVKGTVLRMIVPTPIMIAVPVKVDRLLTYR